MHRALIAGLPCLFASVAWAQPAPILNGNNTSVTATGGATAKKLPDWFANAPDGLGTAAAANTGTSGAMVPLLNGANTWSGAQGFGSASVSGSNFSITGGTISNATASAAKLTATGGTTARTLADKANDTLSIADFGGSAAAEIPAYLAAVSYFTTKGGGVLRYPSQGSAGWNKIHATPLPGMILDIDGPGISPSMLGFDNTSPLSSKALYGYLVGNHTGNRYLFDLAALADGSNAPNSGPGVGTDTAMRISIQRKDWKTTSVPGQVGGLFIQTYSGGSTTDLKSGGYAMNTSVQCMSQTGFCTQYEGLTQVFDASNNVIYAQDIQFGIENDRDNAFYGINAGAQAGTHQAFIRALNSGTGRWGDFLQNSYNSTVTYAVSDTGVVTTKADETGTTTLRVSNLAGVQTTTNSAGTVLTTLDQSGNFTIGGKLQDTAAATWASGGTYTIGQRVTAGAYTYRLQGGTAAATVQPTHTSGVVTGADGLVWRYVGPAGPVDLIDTTHADVRLPATLYLRSLADPTSGGDVPLIVSTGSPEASVKAPQGSVFVRTDGDASKLLYLKTDSSTATNWQPLTTASVTNAATAAGTTQGTAYAITAQTTAFTTVASGTGAVLPFAYRGAMHVVNAGANALALYPSSGGQINTKGTNNALSVAAGSMAFCIYAANTQEYCTVSVMP